MPQQIKIMKYIKLLIFSTLILFSLQTAAQANNKGLEKPDASKKILIVEVSCGECQFKMEGKSCDLAVRINGKSYFVDGTNIDEHGDAHAKDGFCEAIKKAEVQGEIINGRFKVSYFKVINTK